MAIEEFHQSQISRKAENLLKANSRKFVSFAAHLPWRSVPGKTHTGHHEAISQNISDGVSVSIVSNRANRLYSLFTAWQEPLQEVHTLCVAPLRVPAARQPNCSDCVMLDPPAKEPIIN